METTNPAATSNAQNIARVLLGLMLTTAGIGHLTFARIPFRAQVPEWVPLDVDLTVLLSGIVEILLGLTLVFLARYKRQMGWLLALFFVMVFPGNLAQYLNRKAAFGLDTDGLRLMRLFFQPVLIVWALWSTNVWKRNS